MSYSSRIQVTAFVICLFACICFAAPAPEPIANDDHDETAGSPFENYWFPPFYFKGTESNSGVDEVVKRAVPDPLMPEKRATGSRHLPTGTILLIVFASVLGAIIILGCIPLILARRARKKGINVDGAVDTTSTAPVYNRSNRASTASAWTIFTPTLTTHVTRPFGRERMSEISPAPAVEKPMSPLQTMLQNPLAFAKRMSRVVVIDKRSAVAAGGGASVYGDEKSLRSVDAVSTSAMAREVPPLPVPAPTPPAVPVAPASPVELVAPGLKRQMTTSVCSTVYAPSIPPCPPTSPEVPLPAIRIPPVPTHPPPRKLSTPTEVTPQMKASLARSGSAQSSSPSSPGRFKSTITASFMPAPRAAKPTSTSTSTSTSTASRNTHPNSLSLARSVVKRNMLALAHSSRTQPASTSATDAAQQHPFAAPTVMSAGQHAPRPETLLRPPALKVDTAMTGAQGMWVDVARGARAER